VNAVIRIAQEEFMEAPQSTPQWPMVTLAAFCVAAWVYVAYLAWGMENMDVGAEMLLMPAMVGWGEVDLLLVLLMWTLMMAAMMLPSALPMLRTFAALGRRASSPRSRSQTLVFAAGYLAVWAGFSVLATLGQWGLLEARLVSPMMVASSQWLGGALLLGAGIYQLTPWKARCLTNCRSPLAFLMAEWRSGWRGALRMGWRHGLYCLGCCWALMLLLFVMGVMNLAWIAALSVLVVLEKRLPSQRWLLRASAAVFCAWGLLLLLGV
jgi:predicted metal-binding membrane protein